MSKKKRKYQTVTTLENTFVSIFLPISIFIPVLFYSISILAFCFVFLFFCGGVFFVLFCFLHLFFRVEFYLGTGILVNSSFLYIFLNLTSHFIHKYNRKCFWVSMFLLEELNYFKHRFLSNRIFASLSL